MTFSHIGHRIHNTLEGRSAQRPRPTSPLSDSVKLGQLACSIGIGPGRRVIPERGGGRSAPRERECASSQRRNPCDRTDLVCGELLRRGLLEGAHGLDDRSLRLLRDALARVLVEGVLDLAAGRDA